MQRIRAGDVHAQAKVMTGHMRDVLALIEAGDAVYGRAIAKKLRVPYPQAYRTLHVLYVRRFLAREYGEPDTDQAQRLVYSLTDAGRELLDVVRDVQLVGVGPRGRDRDVDPEEYAQRMHVSGILAWLKDLGAVDSYRELKHIVSCAQCTSLIKTYGIDGDVRCMAYTHDGETT